MKALGEACGVVELEGPAHVAGLARHVVSCAESYARPYERILILIGNNTSARDALEARRVALDAAIQEFTTAARNHLNGSGQ